jgi:hypothetical protein
MHPLYPQPQGFVTLVQLEAHFSRRLQEDRRSQDSGGLTADELDYYLTQQKHMYASFRFIFLNINPHRS